jgi:hypothetical protein
LAKLARRMVAGFSFPVLLEYAGAYSLDIG